MSPYKVIFVDWYKTLCFDRFWEHWAKPGHPKNETFRALQQAFFADASRLIAPWMRGELAAEEVLRIVAAEIDACEELLMSELIASCRAMRFIDPEAPALIKELRSQGKRVVLATDNMDTFGRWTVPSLRLERMFDDILCSYEMKCVKEDVDDQGCSLFFSPYLAQRKIAPVECVLLDDSLGLGAIAEAMGMEYRPVCGETSLIAHLNELTDPAAMCPSRRCREGC